MNPGKLLVVDDNKGALTALQLLLEQEFAIIKTLSNPNGIAAAFRQEDFDVVLLDMNFTAGVNSGNEGFYWLKEIKKRSPSTEVIMLTAYGDVQQAVRSVKEGATDFILKPWENEKLLTTVKSAWRIRNSNKELTELRLRERSLKDELNKEETLVIGSSPEIRKVMQMVEKVAGTDANVLLTGENGTGKGVIARHIHQLSERKNECFVTVDMGAIPSTLFESELFGHKKGAFTDAKEDRIGKFQLADRGTLFLDEIGNIPLMLQAKVLVALQNKSITPIGSNKLQTMNIRLVSATNANIEQEVFEGRFREDLLYRLNTIKIELPPLRERGEDIELLACHYLGVYQKKYRKPNLRLGSQAIKKLNKYHWPGNIRELDHAIEKSVILSENEILMPEDFSLRAVEKKGQKSFQTLDEMEQMMIAEALDKCNGNYSKVSEMLGVSRQTLYNKIKRYGL